MDRASSGSLDTAWAASSRSMGTSSQGIGPQRRRLGELVKEGRLAEQAARGIDIQYPLPPPSADWI